MDIAFMSSYIPRKCGLATYTKDLTLGLIDKGDKVNIIAIKSPLVPVRYSKEIFQTIDQEKKAQYTNLADELNKSSNEIIHIQHEFGLFGGDEGEYVIELAEKLTKPLVVTLHTILAEPNAKQRKIIGDLARLSRRIIVMDEVAKSRLRIIYKLKGYDIKVIPHGVPDVNGINKSYARRKLGVNGSFVLLASNLISRNKGFEYAIRALPKVIKDIPNLEFLIVGETHPIVKKKEGESYRKELMSLVNDLSLKQYVRFVNKYVSLDELRMYYAIADVYITPYLDSQQITSGSLAYALGAGRACISTPYSYARSRLANKAGILTQFRDSDAIANALLDLYKNPALLRKFERGSYLLGSEMRWNRIAVRHQKLYKNVISPRRSVEYIARKSLTNPNIAYLKLLTSEKGIAQHAFHNIPDYNFGYSTDDNARALLVVSNLYRHSPSMELEDLMKKYIAYLKFAQDEGKFHIFLSYDGKWLDKAGVHDAYARALWSLGHHLKTCPESPFFEVVHTLFRESIQHLNKVKSLRTAAYSIFGLFYYWKTFMSNSDESKEVYDWIVKFAEKLVLSYKKESELDWRWFEKKMTYDNFRIPQALLYAYNVTGNTTYRDVAGKSLDFLIEKNYDSEKNFFDFIGCKGWCTPKNKSSYDQQPLEPAAATDSLILACQVIKKKRYLELAYEAYQWYFGRNRNSISMISKSGGVFDGLTRDGLNPNQGSESIVTFLIAQQSLGEYLKKI